MSHSFLIAIICGVLGSYSTWKLLKGDYSKSISKEENLGNGFFFVLWWATCFTENCTSAGAVAHKVEKLVFGPTLTLILPIFAEREKGKIYVLKKVGRSTFKEVL